MLKKNLMKNILIEDKQAETKSFYLKENNIYGKLGCVFFYKNGKVKKMCILKKGNILRVQKNLCHTMLPLTNHVIYHESRIGLFLKKLIVFFQNGQKIIISLSI